MSHCKSIAHSPLIKFSFRGFCIRRRGSRIFSRTLFTCLLLASISGLAHGENLQICTDINYWYPYTFESAGTAKGIHIDIVTLALNNLEHKFTFTPLPWKRCLKETINGKYNAVVSGSYKPERAVKLLYPPDAPYTKKSKWRITQVEYVVVSHIDNAFIFNGDLSTIPEPARAPLGYSIVDDLRKKRIEVITASNTYDNFKQLVNSKRGVVISPPQNAIELSKIPEFKDKLKIHSTPIKSKSYFLLFSKTNPGLDEQMQKILWNEIKNIRNNAKYMKELMDSY